MEEIKDALESIVWQYGYRGVKDGKPTLYTGGMGALEQAFDALGWDDPHFVDEKENTCEIDGCMEEPSSGMNWGELYLSLCYKHSAMQRRDEERPPVKQWALDREATRDPITRCLPFKNHPSENT